MVLLCVLHAIFFFVLRTFRLVAGLYLVSGTGGLRVLSGSRVLASGQAEWVLSCLGVHRFVASLLVPWVALGDCLGCLLRVFCVCLPAPFAPLSGEVVSGPSTRGEVVLSAGVRSLVSAQDSTCPCGPCAGRWQSYVGISSPRCLAQSRT